VVGVLLSLYLGLVGGYTAAAWTLLTHDIETHTEHQVDSVIMSRSTGV